MSQFCKRQPAACEVGGQAATVIGQRAQDGARKLYQIITDKRSPDHTGSIGGGENADASLPEAAPRDTLTPDDLHGGMAGTADAVNRARNDCRFFNRQYRFRSPAILYRALGLSAGHDDDRRNQG